MRIMVRGLVENLSSSWHSYFYEPESTFNLGFTRFLFFIFIAQYTLFFDRFSQLWSYLPHQLWHPVWPLSIFDRPPFGPDGFILIYSLFIFLCVLCALGFFTRLNNILAATLGTTMYAYRVSFLEGSHDNLGIVVFLWIFACSFSGDSFSIDSLRQKENQTFRKRVADRQAQGLYSWPIKLMMIFFASIYVSAGFSKIYNGGLQWLWGDTVKHYFLFSHYKSDLDPLGQSLRIGLLMAQFPLLCKIGGFSTVLIELATVTSPFSQKSRYIIIPAMFIWHVGFYFTSSNGFFNMTALFFCWINWQWLFYSCNLISSKEHV